MKLPCNWKATFDDESRRVELRKVVAGPIRNQCRKMCVQYTPPLDFLKPIDRITGEPLVSICHRLPPQTSRALLAACRERWA